MEQCLQQAESAPIGQAFISAARGYCRVVEHAHELPLPERAARFIESLTAVYGAAIRLPEMGESLDLNSHPSRPAQWPGFDGLEHYWMVFDPYDMADHEPVVGDLTDDLLDIYRDLRRGLDILNERDSLGDAVLEWNVHFTHWGHHAVDALCALHHLHLRVREWE